MEKINDVQIREMFYKRNDSKDIIKKINKECLKKGISNKAILSFIKDELTFEELDESEKATIFNSIYEITKMIQYKYKELSISNEIEESNSIVDDYIEQLMKLEYIGLAADEDMNCEKKKEELKKYDEYQLSKLLMLNEKYSIKSTKITYFTIYQTNLHFAEEGKEKDLMKFTTKEIEILIESLTYTYGTIKQNLIAFINLYCEWCKEKGLIKKNPCDKLNRKLIKINSKIFLANKICGKKEFYNMLKEMEENTKLPNLIPLLLARYGIKGEGLEAMISLRWDDVDEENKVVHIQCNNNISQLPIDDKFIEYIHKAKKYTESDKSNGKNMVRYSDFGYVLKKAFSEKDEENGEQTIKYASVFTRVNEACKSIGVPRISFNRLLLSRQLEILLEMRKNRRLKQSDFEYVVSMFDFGEEELLTNRAFNIKKIWLELTGDAVITQRKNTRNLSNDNSFNIYEELKEDLDLCL